MRVGVDAGREGDSVLARALAWGRPPLSLSRQVTGWLIGAGTISTLTWILAMNRGGISVASSLILYLPVVVITTAVGGSIAGLAAAIVSPAVANWYLVPPYHTFRVGDWENILELGVFIFVASVVSLFASRAARRELEALQARSHALALARLFERTGSDEVADLLEAMCDTFDLDSASIRHRFDGTVYSTVRRGQDDRNPVERIPLDEVVDLELGGLAASARGSLLFSAHVSELSRCIERQQLQERALEAEALSRVDELRNALLRAVSHDLRTPLSGIKAAVSGLLQEDVVWNDCDRRELLSLVEAETDRLTSIVTNLLDLSRIEAGVVAPRFEMCGLDDIIAEALADPRFSGRVDASHSQDQYIRTDSSLLVRVIANLLENALKWSPSHQLVTLTTENLSSGLKIVIMDRGPGIPDDQKGLVRKPFHRVSDSGHSEGLGLGLAIVDRLVEILGGTFEFENSPEGGLKTTLVFPHQLEGAT